MLNILIVPDPWEAQIEKLTTIWLTATTVFLTVKKYVLWSKKIIQNLPDIIKIPWQVN